MGVSLMPDLSKGELSMRRSKLTFTLFLAPALLSFLLVVIIPMMTGIYYSFTDWNGINDTINFVGFSNYSSVFTQDPSFVWSFGFTAVFAILAVLFCNLIGFLLALMVTRELAGRNMYRAVFFMPNLIGGLLLGFTWQFIFTKIFESLGKAWGLPFLEGWLSNTATGFWGLVIVAVWQMSGYMMIIYIAALQGIPDSLIEAAKIDGASTGRIITRIMMPMVAPAFTVCTFISLSNSFKLFDQNLALTNGAPNNSTMMLALNIYNVAFTKNLLGQAQARALIFMLAVAAITLTQLYFNKKREVEL